MSRVLVLHHAPYVGGGSAGLRDLLFMLRSHHEAIAVLPPGPKDLQTLLRSDGFRVISAPRSFPTLNAYSGGPWVGSRGYWQGLTHVSGYGRWTSFIEELRPDVVIVNSSVLAPMGPAIRSAGARSICVVRETFSRSPADLGSKALSLMLANWWDANVFISAYDRDNARRTAPVTAVVRDSVRPGLLTQMPRSRAERELGVDSGCFNVLFTGGDTWFKGLDVLLAAAQMARLPDLRILVAGYFSDGPAGMRRVASHVTAPENAAFRRRLGRLMADPEVVGAMKILGARTDMSACYSAADTVVFPATVAHQARPIIEAAHYALPVIRTDFDQYLEHVEDPLTFPVGEASRLAELLVQLRGDPALVRSLGAGNRVRIQEANDFDAQARSLHGVIGSLLPRPITQ